MSDRVLASVYLFLSFDATSRACMIDFPDPFSQNEALKGGHVHTEHALNFE
jgi:hypothetical protein